MLYVDDWSAERIVGGAVTGHTEFVAAAGNCVITGLGVAHRNGHDGWRDTFRGRCPFLFVPGRR